MLFHPTRIQKETIGLMKCLIRKHFKINQKYKQLKLFNQEIHYKKSIGFFKLSNIQTIIDIQTFVEEYFEAHMTQQQFEYFLFVGGLLDETHLEIIEDCFNNFASFEAGINENLIPSNFGDKSIDCIKPKKLFGSKGLSFKRNFEKQYFPRPYFLNKIIHPEYKGYCPDEYGDLLAIEQMFPFITKINKLFLKQEKAFEKIASKEINVVSKPISSSNVKNSNY